MKRLTFALFIILAAPPFLYAGKMTLAVMDFKADGVSRQQARRISELIRTEMINTGRYTVVERKQMNQILKEQGFQKSGCSDQDCAVKIGKLLSARYILIGTVMKFGRSVVINGRIVDVEKGVGLFGQKQRAKTDDDLFDAVNKFASKLTSRITGESVAVRNYSPPVRQNNYRNVYDISSQHEYHSPVLAGFVSLAPFWSGSFNKGFDGWGMGFVTFKTSGAILFFSLLSKMSADQDSVDYTQKYDVPCFAGFGAWMLFTVIDIIYSSYVIYQNNKSLASADLRKPAQDVAYSIQPKFFVFEGRASVEGLNAGISLHF